MIIDTSPGTYGEAWPNGVWLTTVDCDRDVLFLRVNDDGALCGQEHTTGEALLCWPTGEWIGLGPTAGISPVAFGPEQTVYVSRADGVHVFDYLGMEVDFRAGYLGSQGIRSVRTDGTVVSGDSTLGDGVVSEYTELSDGTRIGQGHDDGGIIAKTPDGQVHRLASGADYFCRVNEVGPDVALCWTDFAQNFRLLTTLAAIHAVPPDAPERPIGPTSSPRVADGRVYDVLPFIVGDAALWPRSGPTHPQHQVLAGDLIHYVKFGNPQAYETWAHDDVWIYHLEDASGSVYSLSDPRWLPRTLAIGEAHAFDTGEHDVITRDRNTCGELRRDPIRRKMWLHALYDGWYWGPGLGERATVLVAYDNTAGIHTAGRFVELYAFAYGAGWVRWQAYDANAVYVTGPAIFTADGLAATSDFYRIGGPAPAPALTGCVPQVCPHYPPLTPPTPPEPPEPPDEDPMLPPIGDTEIIELSERWINRYQIIGRYQTQSAAENLRDEAYWTIDYCRSRDAGKDHEHAIEAMENGMASEAGQPLPFPPS